MTVAELARCLNAEIASDAEAQREITGGMACDVMSLSIARGFEGMAWVCAQANMNALAIAVMMDAACVIFAQCMKIDRQVLERAEQEHMNVLRTNETVFDVVGQMYAAGIRCVQNAKGRREKE